MISFNSLVHDELKWTNTESNSTFVQNKLLRTHRFLTPGI
jgi:hypothetical protein